MRKLVRRSFPIEITAGILLIVFILATLLASQLFDVPWLDLSTGIDLYIGMLLVAFAVVMVVIIIWEELLFHVNILQVEGGEVFRNHKNKLLTQVLIYLIIPAIFVFIYLEYPELNEIRFFIWASICILLPVAVKLISGINNYNDFLTLTNQKIAYKNNKLEGEYALSEVKEIDISKDSAHDIEKLHLI